MTKQTIYNYTNTLREHRKKHGLLQSQVSKLLGFTSTDRISMWEKGISVPSIVNLFKLSVLYRVNPLELYTDLTDITEDEVEGRKLEAMQLK